MAGFCFVIWSFGFIHTLYTGVNGHSQEIYVLETWNPFW